MAHSHTATMGGGQQDNHDYEFDYNVNQKVERSHTHS